MDIKGILKSHFIHNHAMHSKRSVGGKSQTKSFISNAISEKTLILKWQTSIIAITMAA
jgi:hypothetical protein